MFSRLLLTLSALVLISSCNTGNIGDVADPSVLINMDGASVLPPEGYDWVIVAKDETNIVFSKRGSTPDSTYAASVITVKLPEEDSNQQFAQEMRSLVKSEKDKDRFKPLLSEGKLSTEKNIVC